MEENLRALLLKDLCARLPYGLVINTGDKNLALDRQHQGIGILYPEDCSDEFNERNNNASFYITISGCYYGEEIKPYLRPMSSMTEEEKKELQLAFNIKASVIGEYEISSNETWWVKDRKEPIGFETIPYKSFYGVIDWLNAHHFDYRGLIEKGLALEAPEGMYNFQ